MKKILFVCLGNICRSPAAEGVMQHAVDKRGLRNKIILDSAGTSAAHSGERADSRMRFHAEKRGVQLLSVSRQFLKEDFLKFDYIIVMDRSNYKNVLNLDFENKYENKVKMMTDFCSDDLFDYVPDPYYGGENGFELVLDIVVDACNGLLNFLEGK